MEQKINSPLKRKNIFQSFNFGFSAVKFLGCSHVPCPRKVWRRFWAPRVFPGRYYVYRPWISLTLRELMGNPYPLRLMSPYISTIWSDSWCVQIVYPHVIYYPFRIWGLRLVQPPVKKQKTQANCRRTAGKQIKSCCSQIKEVRVIIYVS